jgi:hypothetical protein
VKVFRYELPVDDEIHDVPAGKVLMVNAPRLDVVEVWIETEGGEFGQGLTVVGTGHEVQEAWTHVGSCIYQLSVVTRLVWHVYRVGN